MSQNHEVVVWGKREEMFSNSFLELPLPLPPNSKMQAHTSTLYSCSLSLRSLLNPLISSAHNQSFLKLHFFSSKTPTDNKKYKLLSLLSLIICIFIALKTKSLKNSTESKGKYVTVEELFSAGVSSL